MIYHLTTEKYWSVAQHLAFFIDEHHMSQGFIHCCSHEQIDDVLLRFFSNFKQGLMLLSIDEEKLTARLKWEPGDETGRLFPHVYGLINREAIVAAHKIKA